MTETFKPHVPSRSPITGRFRSWVMRGDGVIASPNWDYLYRTTPIFYDVCMTHNHTFEDRGWE